MPICCDALDRLAPRLALVILHRKLLATPAGDTDDEVGAEAGEDDRPSSQFVNDWPSDAGPPQRAVASVS